MHDIYTLSVDTNVIPDITYHVKFTRPKMSSKEFFSFSCGAGDDVFLVTLLVVVGVVFLGDFFLGFCLGRCCAFSPLTDRPENIDATPWVYVWVRKGREKNV